ncbi:MAG TPA: hypothetical protein ENF55_00305 [Thermoprotei archaeon]|nr:hypothetical protein [Thermoprotei archaeon]
MQKNISVSIRLSYIHGERLVEETPRELQVQLQMALPSGEIVLKENKLEIPYLVSLATTPPAANITVKGVVLISGDKSELRKLREEIKKKKVPPFIMNTLMQFAFFEIMLLARELGLPPPVPIPQISPKQVKTGKPPYIT